MRVVGHPGSYRRLRRRKGRAQLGPCACQLAASLRCAKSRSSPRRPPFLRMTALRMPPARRPRGRRWCLEPRIAPLEPGRDRMQSRRIERRRDSYTAARSTRAKKRSSRACDKARGFEPRGRNAFGELVSRAQVNREPSTAAAAAALQPRRQPARALSSIPQPPRHAGLSRLRGLTTGQNKGCPALFQTLLDDVRRQAHVSGRHSRASRRPVALISVVAGPRGRGARQAGLFWSVPARVYSASNTGSVPAGRKVRELR